MIKEALQYITGLANTKIWKVEDVVYSTETLSRIKEPIPNTIHVHSLSGLVEYLQSNFDEPGQLMVHVESPTSITVYSQLNRDAERKVFIKAEAMIPSFRFDSFYDPETFNIKLQSVFVQNEDRDIMLKVVGNIKEEAVQTIGDDGVSQQVVAKAGPASVANVQVPNPVVLAPFRTFVEVKQPESNFVFRMQSGPACALFEADGGAWKLKAMEYIRKYLVQTLQEEINKKKIKVIA
ncbi:hypothetical protein [Bacillus sp. FSL K6-3458]|uniref:hypothetical protein n=1 Tax=Bacillus sp. FSL K6-3458 TaxID=2921501 RepID=UPI0030F7EC9D